MIYTEKTKKAINVAFNANSKNIDNFGIPYIYHLITIAERMKTEETFIVALLSESIRHNTEETFELLRKDFSKEIVDAIKVLIYDKPSGDYMEYIKKVKTNPIATRVKLEYLKAELDVPYVYGITEKQDPLLYSRINACKKAIIYLSE